MNTCKDVQGWQREQGKAESAAAIGRGLVEGSDQMRWGSRIGPFMADTEEVMDG